MSKTTEKVTAAALLDRQAQALWPVLRSVVSPWVHGAGYANPTARKAEFRVVVVQIMEALAAVED